MNRQPDRRDRRLAHRRRRRQRSSWPAWRLRYWRRCVVRRSSAGAVPAGAATVDRRGSIVLGPPGAGRRSARPSTAGRAIPRAAPSASSGANLLRGARQLRRARGRRVPDGRRDGRAALRNAAADHLGRAIRRSPTSGTSASAADRSTGYPRVIDLWWELAGRLGSPVRATASGRGPCGSSRTPATGAGASSVHAPEPVGDAGPSQAAPRVGGGERVCGHAGAAPSARPGARATLLADRPARRLPPARRREVRADDRGRQRDRRQAIRLRRWPRAAAEQIAPSYDCSSSVDHILYGGGLLPVTDDATSADARVLRATGPGRWVTIYANADHVFMYVAGLAMGHPQRRRCR